MNGCRYIFLFYDSIYIFIMLFLKVKYTVNKTDIGNGL